MESLVEEGRHTLNVGNTVRGPQMDKREKKVLHEVAVFTSHCFQTLPQCSDMLHKPTAVSSQRDVLYLIPNHEPKLIFFPYVTYNRYFVPESEK